MGNNSVILMCTKITLIYWLLQEFNDRVQYTVVAIFTHQNHNSGF